MPRRRGFTSFVAAWLTLAVGFLGLAVLAPLPAQAVDGDVSYVGAASTAGNRTNHTVQVPASVASGDLLVLFMTLNSSSATIATPTGWTPVQTVTGNRVAGRAWARIASTGSAGSTVSVTTSATTKSVLTVAAYRSSVGQPTVEASANSLSNASTSTHPAPSVNVANANSWLLSYWSEKSGSAVTWTLPAEVVSRSSGAATGSGKVSAVLADSGSVVPVGDTGTRTATTSPATSRAVRFSLVVQGGTDGDPDPNGVPTASFTSSCSGLTCQFNASASGDPDGDPLTYSWNFGDQTSGTGVSPSHTYASAGNRTVTLTVSDGQDTASTTRQVSVNDPLPPGGPSHTVEVSDTVRTNMPRVTAGEILDLERIGNRVYVVGGFTSIRNNSGGNTTSYSQRYLAAFDMNTGLVDANFRPTFDNTVQDVEASPDGTKLYVAGRFNTVNGVTKRKFASINPTTGATVTGFTAHANAAGTELEATNTTVYLGGQYTAINGASKIGLAAVDANTGALIGRSGQNPRGSWNNDISGGIGPNGRLNVQELKLTPDLSKLMVVHTGRQIAGQNRYGVGFIDTATGELTPWRTRLWEDNLGSVGGTQRIYAGDIAPNGEYFVVGSGSGGDRPPINDTAVAMPIAGADLVEPLWVSRMFDSIYSIGISEVAVYVGGHMSWSPSQTARDPWPGLDNVGYGTGQGLSGYGLGDEVLRRDHVTSISPANGKSLHWNPGSNSFEGNKAMLVTPRGLITGGDATTQGGQNVGRIAAYDLLPTTTPANVAKVTAPIEGRVVNWAEPYTMTGTARATSGVQRVQVEVRNRNTNRYLQDDLVTWGAANTINVTLANPGATETEWSLPLTFSENLVLEATARTFGQNGSRSAKDVNKFETFSTTDAAPRASFSSPSSGAVTSTTFMVTGTATDDFGVQSLSYTVRDDNNRYLQDDGSALSTYNSFGLEPDVVGATSTTWSTEITVPYEGTWRMQVTPRDTAGQSSLDTFDRTWIVTTTGIAPSVTIAQPVAMTPPNAVPTVVVAPGSPITFSGTASDDEDLRNVEITLRNTSTRENLAADGTWGVDLNSGWYRITPENLNGNSTNWSYTTPFNLSPGSYTFTVRAVDDVGLRTSSAQYGRLSLSAQIPGDNPPDTLLSVTGTQPVGQSLDLTLTGTATDDQGVQAVEVSLRDIDTGRYLQDDGSLSGLFDSRQATLESPGATSTNWTLNVTLPTEGDWSVIAVAIDTAGQGDFSTTGATARYPIFPGDTPPAVVMNLLQPQQGTVFTGGRIQASGRFEDNSSTVRGEIAIVDSLGRYMSSSGAFTSTNETWIRTILTSPGSPGTNYSYTSPVVPVGTYTVRVRGTDENDLLTDPTVDVTVSVEWPPNTAPVAAFTVTCNENICGLDGRASTDENPATMVYSWDFGNGTGTGAFVSRTYTAAATYTVTLTVQDEYGATSTATQEVTITEPPDNVAPNPVISPPICNGLTCSFSSAQTSDPNAGDAITRLWDWGDGTPTSTTTSLSHTFPASGTYTVTLTATDGWGKSATTTRQVTVTAP